MNFALIENFHQKWRDILVIGKTIERDNKKYHIVGMTLADEAELYIIEPYIESENSSKPKKSTRSLRGRLREQEQKEYSYLHCRDFYFGDERLQVQGGQGGSLEFSTEDYGLIQVFFDMMSAGWTIPEWLKDADWNSLQLVTLKIADIEKLPAYSPKMPITIKHRPDPVCHILEKTVTLQVGKSRSFSFIDNYGDKVWCHINNVTLIDVWKDAEEQLRTVEQSGRFSPEQLQQAKKHTYDALEQNCLKGMCYVGVEYECSKELNLVFYSKQYLNSKPETHRGSSTFFLMRLKPDKEIGTHNLPLRGFVIATPVSPDTVTVPAELFQYFEKAVEWTETIPGTSK